jgi:hypothetical protein
MTKVLRKSLSSEPDLAGLTPPTLQAILEGQPGYTAER